MTAYRSADAIRTRFSAAMSLMYRNEVPLYADLLDIVATINAQVLDGLPQVSAADMARLGCERHGAIRVGTAGELAALRRIFAVMGMHPVAYYDLAMAGVPVHSTAFRPIEPAALDANPFRVFVSLLRPELIEDEDLRARAATILAGRQIVSDRAMGLVAQWESAGGLTDAQAEVFECEVLDIFRWHAQAIVDLPTYERLNGEHRLIADVVSFRGPHINHLTPRTLDIDAAQEEMRRRGMQAKAVVEGPPRRAVPILLRQTSFKALDEAILFADGQGGQVGAQAGTHTARFGEIEQRGAALTPAGRDLYDACLAEALGTTGDYGQRLAEAFARFPDDSAVMRREGLAYFTYAPTAQGLAVAAQGGIAGDVEDWIAAGWAACEALIYEDFLPVSAAGIFRSNLGDAAGPAYEAQASQRAFEEAMGAPLHDPFALYAARQSASLDALRAAFGLAVPA